MSCLNYIKKNNESRKRIIGNYYCFLEVNFRFQPKVCDGCHDLMHNVISFNDISIISVKGNDYRIHLSYISKNEAINILNDSSLSEKSGPLSKHTKLFFYLYVKDE